MNEAFSIAVTSRRRYGHSTNDGYKHGEVKFSIPVQCHRDWAKVDEDCLKALDAANASGDARRVTDGCYTVHRSLGTTTYDYNPFSAD